MNHQRKSNKNPKIDMLKFEHIIPKALFTAMANDFKFMVDRPAELFSRMPQWIAFNCTTDDTDYVASIDTFNVLDPNERDYIDIPPAN